MEDVNNIYKNHANIQFLIGKNKLLLLEHDSYLYKRPNGKFPKTTWKCVKGCKAKVYTNNGIFLKATSTTLHQHFPPIDEIVVIKTYMKIKFRVETEFNLTPRQIYTQERTKLLLRDDSDAYLLMDSFDKIKHNLYYYRQATFPKAPKHRRDIQLYDHWRMTFDNKEEFLLIDDGVESKILVFGTESNLRILCNAAYVISDGTFSIHPSVFEQLCVFHAPYLGKVLALIFCLLPDKTYNTYCRLLILLKNVALRIGSSFEPSKVHIDYEMAMIKAIDVVFTSDSVQGCFFHFSQCIWRKVQEFGMVEAYKKHKHVKRWIRRFSALPFLPLHIIDDGFIEIHEDAPVPTYETVSSDQIEKFHDYVLNTWVHDSNATFHRTLWNQFENEGPRTTNNAEGWHHKLNQLARSRMSFFQFVHFLKEMQVDIDATKFDLISESPSRKSARAINVNDTIRIAKQIFSTGNVSILDYLDSISITIKLD